MVEDTEIKHRYFRRFYAKSCSAVNLREYKMWLNNVPFVVMNIISCLPLAFLIGTGDKRYVGCYHNSKMGRGISTNPYVSTSGIANSICISTICRVKNYNFAATSDSNICHCSNYVEISPSNDKPSQCNKPCQVDHNQMCGGDGYLSVYRVCIINKFGKECEKDCHCGTDGNSPCNPISGICVEADSKCQPGWTHWPYCQTSCIQGPNDSKCIGECHCLDGVPCNGNGECDDLLGEKCPAGYWDFPKCRKCDLGYYGDECKKLCSGCRGGLCHHIKGICESCPPGYVGEFCDKYCPDGSYGMDCGRKCTGHCANNITCFPTNGTCPDGCMDGYEGTRCESSKCSYITGGITVVVIASLIAFLIDFVC